MAKMKAMRSFKREGIWHAPQGKGAALAGITEYFDVSDPEEVAHLVAGGLAIEVMEPRETDLSLPDDVPYRAKLVAAGIETLADLEAIDDFTSLAGIGAASAEKIEEYLGR